MTSDSLPHQGSAFRAYGTTERAGLNTGVAHSPSEPKVSPGSLCTAWMWCYLQHKQLGSGARSGGAPTAPAAVRPAPCFCRHCRLRVARGLDKRWKIPYSDAWT